MFDVASSIYKAYITTSDEDGLFEHELEVSSSREDLRSEMMASPDYHHNALRNGTRQGLLLTRGGEQHTYNVICVPGDELFAGDIIDAFGEKWIMTEARADVTTHKTGVMHQCNKLFKFQNPGDTTVYERWGYVDISGYSSSFGNHTKIQKGEEQIVMYMPYDEVTKRMFVDKRLAYFSGYDRDGEQILSVLKITGVHPNAESYNHGDHLLMLKAVRDLYSPSQDNLELEICDYVSPDEETIPPESELIACEISGRKVIRLDTTCVYNAVAPDSGVIAPVWSVEADALISYEISDVLSITVPDEESLIGSVVRITLTDNTSKYSPCVMEVEVSNGG